MTTTDNRRKDDARAATTLKWPEAYSICAGTGTAFGKTCVCRIVPCNGGQVHPQSALPSVAPVTTQPTPSDSGSVDTAELRQMLWAFKEAESTAAWDGPTSHASKIITHIDSLIAARVAGVRKDALEEAASMYDTSPHAEEFRVNIAEQIRALIHSPATSSKD